MEMHFSRLLLIVAAALPLGACMTTADQQARAQAIAADDDAFCRGGGAKPGTPAYAQCRQTRSDQRAISEIEARHAMQRQMWMMHERMTQSAMRHPL